MIVFSFYWNEHKQTRHIMKNTNAHSAAPGHVLPQDAAREKVAPDGTGLTRNAAGIGAVTLASRLLALLRDMLLAWVLGASAGVALFWVAFRLVTALRRLLADGSVALGLTPVFQRFLERAAYGAALESTVRAAGCFGMLALVPAIFFALFPQAGTALFAPGLSDVAAEGLGRVVSLCLAYAPFAVALAVLSAFLNALGRFRRAALAPLVFNAVLLFGGLCAFYVAGTSVAGGSTALWLCAWAVPLAGALQVLFVWRGLPCVRTALPHVEGSAPPGHATLPPQALLPHFGRGMLAVAAPQLAGLLCMAVASGMPSGTAALYFSERLIDLPLGLLGISLATALLPELTSLHGRGNGAAFRAMLLEQCRLGLFLAVPAGIGLMAVSPAVVSVLLGHGNFSEAGVQAAGMALLGYAPAIPALVVTRCLMAACFAANTVRSKKAPGRAACAGAVVTVLAALGAARLDMGLFGLGLAAAVGAWVNTLLLLRPAMCPMAGAARAVAAFGSVAVLACAPAAVICHASGVLCALSPAVALPAGVVSGILLYGILASLLRMPEYTRLRHVLTALRKT